MESMNLPFTIKEIRAALSKCKNNVAYNGMLHILLLKHLPYEAQQLLLMTFNIRKNTGIVTNGLNGRILAPQPKPQKNRN